MAACGLIPPSLYHPSSLQPNTQHTRTEDEDADVDTDELEVEDDDDEEEEEEEETNEEDSGVCVCACCCCLSAVRPGAFAVAAQCGRMGKAGAVAIEL